MDDSTMDAALAEWSEKQHPHERADPIWTLLAYRFARFSLEAAARDLKAADRRIPFGTRDQLLRAVTSVSANIAEGYSRPGARERSRYYTYALGSVREAISWYLSVQFVLADGVVDARVAVLTRIRRLLLGLISRGPSPRWPSRHAEE